MLLTAILNMDKTRLEMSLQIKKHVGEVCFGIYEDIYECQVVSNDLRIMNRTEQTDENRRSILHSLKLRLPGII